MKIILINLLCLLILSGASAFSQSVESPSLNSQSVLPDAASEQPAADLEIKAKNYKYQWNREALQNSIELYLKAAEKWKQSQNSDKFIECLREIGKLKNILGDKNAAADIFNEALKISVSANNKAKQAKVLGDLSLLALSDERVSQAKQYFTRALLLADKISDSSARAYALYCAAEFYYFPEQDKSLDYLTQSIALWEKAEDFEGEANALVRLGYIYMDKYEYGLALQILGSALSKWEAMGNLRGQAFTLRAIATVLNLSNEKQKALEYYNRAEQLIPKDIDYFEQGGMYNGLGFIYESYGDWKLSISYREKALELFRKDKHLYGQLATTVSLCRLSGLDGNESAVLDYFNQGKQLSEILKESLYASLLEEELGNFYLSRNNSEKARSSYRKALQFFNSKKNYRESSQITAKLGVLSERENNLSLAEKYFSQSLELNRKVKDTFSETETLFHLAKIAALNIENENALNLVKDSVRLTESLYSNVLNSRLRQTFFSNVFDRYELYINLLMKQHRQFPEQSFDLLALQASEGARARSMLETLSLAETSFTKDAAPETVKRENEIGKLLNIKTDQLTNLLNTNADKTEIDRVAAEMNALAHQLEDIKSILKQNSPIYSAIKNPAPFDVGEFQRAVLDDNSLLLEFSFGDEESYLWLVGKNEFSVSVLPGRATIEPRIQKLRDLLAAREPSANESIEDYQSRVVQAEKDFESESQILSDALFGQIAGKISGKRLIIVPDGKLHYFPVSALPFPNSNDAKPILLTNEVVYAPSASTLLLLSKEAKKSDSAQKNLLVFADPVFTGDDSRILTAAKPAKQSNSALTALNIFRSGESLNSLPRLLASKDEADSIVEIVGSGESNLATGFAATRELVLDPEISRYRIIHFATHGFLDEERPELSSLVLSRFDEQGHDRNGLIRLNDIYSLNLAADLVVLSACSTGIGKEVKGEGLLSLDNAFLQVGAKSVVSSLWKVDDNVTRELMKNFYRELTSGTVTTAEALRRAQIKLRENPRYQSPFYWAAFTVKGNFQSSPRLSKPVNKWIYAAAIFPILFLGICIYCRRRLLNRKIV